jgi:putative endonuclease
MITYKTYILQSRKNNRFYIGSTNDLERRLSEHNSGKSHFTKNTGPWELYYAEEFQDRKEAFLREKQIKSWKKRSMIEKLRSRESSILIAPTGVGVKIGTPQEPEQSPTNPEETQ